MNVVTSLLFAAVHLMPLANDLPPQPAPEELTLGLKMVAFASVCLGAMAGLYLAVLRGRRKRAASAARPTGLK